MSPAPHEPIHILMADDDADDRFLTKKALLKSRLANEVSFVEDGEELMDYLRYKGRYNKDNAPRPDLILLDLNMPRKDGREALQEIKADPELRSIPVVVMTTSQQEQDILHTYDIGVNSFITKPVSFDELVKIMDVIGMYWFQIVKLPGLNTVHSHQETLQETVTV